MLTKAQEKYLETIPELKIVRIYPWNPKTQVTASKLMHDIKSVAPSLNIFYSGASALGISGVNDLDFTIICPKKDFKKHLPNLIKVLGNPDKIGEENIRWEGENIRRDGFEIDIHMTDPENPALNEHIKLFEILKNNRKFLDEYENLKIKSNGIKFKEYQRQKYQFYNRILKLMESGKT